MSTEHEEPILGGLGYWVGSLASAFRRGLERELAPFEGTPAQWGILEAYGAAVFVERSGQFGPGGYLRITPAVSWNWNIEGPSMADGRFVPNKIIHQRSESG